MAAVPDNARTWAWFRGLIVGLVVCRGLVTLCLMPPFEGWDEYQHVGYIVHILETGRPAILGETKVPRSLLEHAVAFPEPKDVVDLQLGSLGFVSYADYWKAGTAPALKPGEIDLYQAQHSVWYYWLVAPLFGALGGVENLRASVGGLRLLNLAFIAGAVWVAIGAIGRLVTRRRDAALIGIVIAAHPLFLINGLRVSNDALGVFLATLAVAGCLTLRDDRLTLRCLGIGLATGGAVLAKAVHFGLVPFVAFCWLALVVRLRPRPGRAALAALALSAGFLLVTQAELRSNLARFGSLTPMQEGVVNRSRGRTASDLVATARSFDWSGQTRRLWLRDTFYAGGWSHLGTARGFIKVYSTMSLIAILGYGWWLVSPRSRREPVYASSFTPMACAVLCLSVTAALGYHMVQSKLAWGRPTTGPWYASAAIPWFLAIVGGGALAWPLGYLRVIVPAVLTATCLAAESSALWGRMVPTFSGGASGLEALRRIASLQPSFLSLPTLCLALFGQVLILVLLILVGLAALRRSGDAPFPPNTPVSLTRIARRRAASSGRAIETR